MYESALIQGTLWTPDSSLMIPHILLGGRLASLQGSMGTHSFSLMIQHILLWGRLASLQCSMGTHSWKLWAANYAWTRLKSTPCGLDYVADSGVCSTRICPTQREQPQLSAQADENSACQGALHRCFSFRPSGNVRSTTVSPSFARPTPPNHAGPACTRGWVPAHCCGLRIGSCARHRASPRSRRSQSHDRLRHKPTPASRRCPSSGALGHGA